MKPTIIFGEDGKTYAVKDGALVERQTYQQPQYDTCPPHNLIPFDYVGAWSASVPPPNRKCTKCLMETRF